MGRRRLSLLIFALCSGACSLLYNGKDLRGTGAAADLGVADLAVLDDLPSASGADLTGNPDLTGALPQLAYVKQTLTLPSNTVGMVFAELNNSAPPELVVVTDTNQLFVFFVTGTGYPTAAQFSMMTCDGANAVVAGQKLGNQTQIAVGCAGKIVTYGITASSPTSITIGPMLEYVVRGVSAMIADDLDGDGNVDLIASDYTAEPTTLVYSVNVLRSVGAGYQIESHPIGPEGAAEEIVLLPSGGATRSIVFLRNSQLVTLPAPAFVYQPTGIKTLEHLTTSIALHPMAGTMELLAGFSEAPISEIGRYTNSGTELTLLPTTLPSSPYPVTLRVADLDADNLADVLVGTYDYTAPGIVATIDLLKLAADGTATPYAPLVLDRVPNFVAIGDLNSDSRADFAVSSASNSSSVDVYRSN